MFDNGASPRTRPSRGPSRISADRRIVRPCFASPVHPDGRDMHSQSALAHRRLRGTPRQAAEPSPPSELGGLAGGRLGEAPPRPARPPASCRPERRARAHPAGRAASRPRSPPAPPPPPAPLPRLPGCLPPFPRASPPPPALLPPPRALPSPAVRRPAHRASPPVPSSAPGLPACRRADDDVRVERTRIRIGDGYRFLPTYGAYARDARVRQGRGTASFVARGAGLPREQGGEAKRRGGGCGSRGDGGRGRGRRGRVPGTRSRGRPHVRERGLNPRNRFRFERDIDV